jgi:hypothetical protein
MAAMLLFYILQKKTTLEKCVYLASFQYPQVDGPSVAPTS